jgi:hypothetical protein
MKVWRFERSFVRASGHQAKGGRSSMRVLARLIIAPVVK